MAEQHPHDSQQPCDEPQVQLAPMAGADGSALPGRQKRRRRSKRRRVLRVLEPFLILAGLGILSTGMVKVVETRVPTAASRVDSVRLERAQEQARAEVRELAASLESDWVPTVGDDDLFDEELLVGVDAWDGSLAAEPRLAGDAPESDDQFSMPISSTSNTSAAPPGMLGGAPLSP